MGSGKSESKVYQYLKIEKNDVIVTGITDTGGELKGINELLNSRKSMFDKY